MSSATYRARARGQAFSLPAARAAAALGRRWRPRRDPAYQDRLRVHEGAVKTLDGELLWWQLAHSTVLGLEGSVFSENRGGSEAQLLQ